MLNADLLVFLVASPSHHRSRRTPSQSTQLSTPLQIRIHGTASDMRTGAQSQYATASENEFALYRDMHGGGSQYGTLELPTAFLTTKYGTISSNNPLTGTTMEMSLEEEDDLSLSVAAAPGMIASSSPMAKPVVPSLPLTPSSHPEPEPSRTRSTQSHKRTGSTPYQSPAVVVQVERSEQKENGD